MGASCDAELDQWGRHKSRCMAGWNTRLHNSLVRCLARGFRDAGLQAEVEVVMADLHRQHADGRVVEARMDLMITRSGGVRSWPIDVRTIDSFSRHGFASLQAAMEDACRRKRTRYSGQVRPFVSDTRGGLHLEARELLDELAAEAALALERPPPPSLLVRRWRRQLELVTAYEWAEALRASKSEAGPDVEVPTAVVPATRR